MNVKELREELNDIPDEAVVLHATVRCNGETIILTDADYDADEGDDEEDEADDIEWPEDPM